MPRLYNIYRQCQPLPLGLSKKGSKRVAREAGRINNKSSRVPPQIHASILYYPFKKGGAEKTQPLQLDQPQSRNFTIHLQHHRSHSESHNNRHTHRHSNHQQPLTQ